MEMIRNIKRQQEKLHKRMIKKDVEEKTLTRMSAKIGNGASTVPTFADTEPRLTVINTAKPSAVIGDDITIGN